MPLPTRRRRLLDRLSRISSSPQLTPLPPILAPSSLSTPTLPLAASSAKTTTVEIPFGTHGESLHITVPVPPRPPRDCWTPLPPELKLLILRHLPPRDLLRTTATSRDFARLATDGQLWRTLDTSTYYSSIPAAQLAALVTAAGPFIRHLNLRGCRQLAIDWREDAVYNAPRNLRSVVLEGAQPSQSALRYLVVRNPGLRRLHVAGCKALTNSVARLIAQSLPELESADISWCAGVSASGLRRLLDGCAGSLRELRACGVAGFDDVGVGCALWRANGLVALDVSSCPTLTDEAVRVLCTGPNHGGATAAAGCPPRRWQKLAMAACPHLSDAAMLVLAAHAPHLAALELSGNVALGDGGLVPLFTAARALTHVDVEGCVAVTDASVAALARHHPKLAFLNVGGCGEVSDAGVVQVLRRCRVAAVEADGTRVGDGVLEEAVRAVRYRGVAEVRVSVYDCPGVTWEGVRGVLVQNAAGEGGRVAVKCFYGWQGVVDAHAGMCERGEWDEAERVERAWAAHMGAEEAGGEVRRRRRGIRRGERGRCVIC